MSLFLAIAFGGLGLKFGMRPQRRASSGGVAPTLPDNTTSANEFLILFI